MKTIQLKRGKYVADFPILKVKTATVNRDLNIKHSRNFCEKLTKYHFMVPFILDKSNNLIDGHHRYAQALSLKQKTVPVYIVDWVKTNDKKEHLDAIISLNNNNLKWKPIDYLKQQRVANQDYSYIYDMYVKNKDSISIGNVIGCYLNIRKSDKDFTTGKRRIIDKEFGDFLLENLCRLKRTHGNFVQAYCVREFITIAHSKAKRDMKIVSELFRRYETMIVRGDKAITSLIEFKPAFEGELGTLQRLNGKN